MPKSGRNRWPLQFASGKVLSRPIQSEFPTLKRPMPSRSFFLISWLLLAPLGLADEARALWTGGVQTLLDQHCVKCHGPLEQKK